MRFSHRALQSRDLVFLQTDWPTLSDQPSYSCPTLPAFLAERWALATSTHPFVLTVDLTYFFPTRFFPSIMTLLNIRFIRVW